jgi:uncharacterized protein (DUF1501 family)
MDRRDFMKLASFAGLSVVFPFSEQRRAFAQEDPYDGPLWVMVNAGGGWDPTSLCDPKGRANEEELDPMNNYFTDDIGEAGRIRYAPVAMNDYFFQKYYRQLTIMNGIDTQTNGHDSGSRVTWSGNLAKGHPAFSALLAASVAPSAPMSFLTNGGYDYTGGLIGPTRVGDTGALLRIAFPNRRDPSDEYSRYHTEETWDRINDLQRARLETMIDHQTLPRIAGAQSLLYTARVGDNELARLADFLPEQLDNSNNRIRRQAQVALAGYQAGITVSANLSMGGFDTHGNHDANHFPRLEQLLDGVDFLMEEADRQGIADKLIVVVGSDFGRTPGYNDNQGKDHWSITSMMFMGAGIPGNRVIGATDEGHRPLTVNEDLEVDARGIRIRPIHIHKAMRRLAGIDGSETAALFPLDGEDLPLFG